MSNIYDANTTSDSFLPIELKAINDHDRAAAEYERQLKVTWGIKSAENVFKSGQILREAQERLPYGMFDVLTTQFDIEPSKAKRLIRIGRNAVVGANLHQLPPSYSTLYHLTRLKPKKLQAGIEDGTINKRTTLADVMKMLPKPKPRKTPIPAQSIAEVHAQIPGGDGA